MDRSRLWARTAVMSGVLLLMLALLPMSASSAVTAPGAGRPEPKVIARGRCSGESRWRLAVRQDAGALRVALVVRGGAADLRWTVYMDHNDRGFFAGARISGPDGLFRVRRSVVDAPGVDRFRIAATSVRETCRGRVHT